MNKSLRTLLALYQITGGVLGFAFIGVAPPKSLNFVGFIILLWFGSLFILSIAAGVYLFTDEPRGIRFTLLSQCAQVVGIISPYLVYICAVGVGIRFNLSAQDLQSSILNTHFILGNFYSLTHFELFLLPKITEWGISLNVVALALLVSLSKYARNAAQKESAPLTANIVPEVEGRQNNPIA